MLPAEGEHLTTGWEPELAADDTLVRQAVLVHASWPAELGRSAGRPWRAAPGWTGAYIGDRGAFTNLVMLTQPPSDPAAVIAEVNALVPAQVTYALISPWPGDLSSHGLALLGHPPLMVRFPSREETPTPPEVDIVEVTDRVGLAVAERILVDGYPLTDMEPFSAGDLFGLDLLDGPTHVWLAMSEGEPVAVSVAHLAAGITLVEYVATLPQARGRGMGAAVTLAATLADPARPAVLLATDDGRPVYERMGYRSIERWTAWLRPAASGA